MKRKLLYLLLGLEALLCAALNIVSVAWTEYFSSIMAFPFEQIAAGLRALSLSGSPGNGLALALLALITMVLLRPMLLAPKGTSRPLESVLNVIFAFGSALSIWLMANPTKLLGLSQFPDSAALPVLKAGLGIALWAVALAWLIARLLRLFKAGDQEKLMGYMEKMLYVLCALFVAFGFLSCPGELVQRLKEALDVNDVIFALLHFAVNLLPYVLDVIITIYALDFLAKHREDSRSQEAVTAAEAFSRFCCLSLLLMTLSTAGLNVLQLLMMSFLSDVDLNLNIPVLSIAFTLAALLFARLIAENKRLADDNDLFI